ncbi:LacI family DNA-binding transcriptional regulator [Protaetiibacter sp. SSC-01]|nr:LacI family DNA-binding transcriptional regulator [Protaetiibacter sp. SSC-01]
MTAADVARSLGLSRATVGFVLNDTPGQTISEATRERVLAEAKRLGYRPHTAARALASGRSHIVLALLPDWPMEYSMRTHLDEAALVLDRAGYSLVTMTPHPGGQAVPLWESLAPDVVFALAPIPDEQYDAIRATGAATIIPGRDEAVVADELHFADGPRLQVAHLLERGRRRIAFAGTTDARLASLVAERRALADATHRELAGEPLAASADLDETDAAARVAEWVAAGVDGVVAYNDDVAALVLGAALRQGIAVPEELAIVGHDDSPIARLLVPALSSVRVDTAGLGRFLADLALSRVSGAEPPGVGPEATSEVVRRETS